MRRQKFTLVELLVVIAIIAILAGLLLPALKKAKDMAKSADCQGRLKQMALGMTGYTSDNNEWYPYANVGDWTSGTNACEAMDSDVFGDDNPGDKADRFYSCPADTVKARRMCYAINGQYNGASGAQDGIVKSRTETTVGGVLFVGPPCRTSQVQVFAGTFLHACYADTQLAVNYNLYNGSVIEWPAWAGTTPWLMGLLHNNATNWGFCDGHAGWMRWQDSLGKGNLVSPKGIWTKTAGD